jgi:di/tricarboxylate transporter
MVGFARRFGINLLGISRQGKPVRRRLRQVEFRNGDALLLQGDADRIAEAVQEYGLLSIAERPITKVGRLPASIAVVSFVAAILLTSLGLLTLPVALGLAALTVVVTGVVPLRDLYESIDWPVIVLLAALIPVGGAIETTGAAQLLAETLAGLSGAVGPVVLLGIVLVLTMWLSDILNNAATVVIVAPVAYRMAEALGANPDTYFMAVAIGASCAFLTPIGHQNNTLVMGPGGYTFGDYTRVGLPLEVLIVAVSMPMLLIFWPL